MASLPNFDRLNTEFYRNQEKAHLEQRLLFASVEGGGQSWLCLVSEGVNPPKAIDSKRFYTTEKKDGKTVPRKPSAVIKDCVQWLQSFEKREGKLASIGIVSFGPCDLNHASEHYGKITTTPKEGWQFTSVVQPFQTAFRNVPIGFDTDVNMVAVSEYMYGGHGEITSSSYITVGTGIGVGMCTNGKPVHGMVHPEGGHIRVPRYHAIGVDKKLPWLDEKGVDNYQGNCKFHCKKPMVPFPCVEGMANSDAIADRLGIDKAQLPDAPDDDPVWDCVAYYLAQLCMSITFLMSPEVIVIGGGVMKRKTLLPLIRKHFQNLLGDYFKNDIYHKDVDKYIVRSKFDAVKGDVHAGVMGGLELARRVYELSDKSRLRAQQLKIEQLNEILMEKSRMAKKAIALGAAGEPSSRSYVDDFIRGFGMLAMGLGIGVGAALAASSLTAKKDK